MRTRSGVAESLGVEAGSRGRWNSERRRELWGRSGRRWGSPWPARRRRVRGVVPRTRRSGAVVASDIAVAIGGVTVEGSEQITVRMQRRGVGARRRGGQGWVGDRGELGVTVGLVARINVEAGRGVEDGRGEVAA